MILVLLRYAVICGFVARASWVVISGTKSFEVVETCNIPAQPNGLELEFGWFRHWKQCS